MFKIGDFSRLTQISIRMLRYYDENGLLVPEYVDEFTGYRMYGVNQIEDVNRIIFLKNLGFSIKEMKEMVLAWNEEDIQSNLKLQVKKIEEKILKEQEKLIRLQGYLEDYNKKEQNMNIQIVMKALPKCNVVSLRRKTKTYFEESEIWADMCKFLGNQLSLLEKKESFSIYHDIDDREYDVDIETCIVVDQNFQPQNEHLLVRSIDEVQRAACFMVYGPYDNIAKAYRDFAKWLDKHDEYCMQGENRQICHVAACHTDNPNEYVTELQIPIKINGQ